MILLKLLESIILYIFVQISLLPPLWILSFYPPVRGYLHLIASKALWTFIEVDSTGDFVEICINSKITCQLYKKNKLYTYVKKKFKDFKSNSN